MTRYLSEQKTPIGILRTGLISRKNNNCAYGYNPKTIEQVETIFQRLRCGVVYVTPFKTDDGYRDLVVGYCDEDAIRRQVFDVFVHDESDVDELVLESEINAFLELYKHHIEAKNDR